MSYVIVALQFVKLSYFLRLSIV